MGEPRTTVQRLPGPRDRHIITITNDILKKLSVKVFYDDYSSRIPDLIFMRDRAGRHGVVKSQMWQ